MSDHHEAVRLDDVVRRADLVVVARPGTPPQRFEEIGIAPGGKPPSKEYPAFRKILHRWKVGEVLWGTPEGGLPKAGELLEIAGAAWDYDLTVHRKRHIDKVNKITIHEVYEPSAPPDDDPRRILILRREPKGWAFVCDISAEPLRALKKIVKLLKPKPGDSAPPGPLRP